MTVFEQVFVAAARLHREEPSRTGFKGNELLRKVSELNSSPMRESTVNAHIYGHCVANKSASPGTYRILYRNPDGTLRLYREGDDYHPDRKNGRVAPEKEALPPEYRELVDWYWSEYTARRAGEPAQDPFLALRGLGKDVWKSLGGERFTDALRSNWFGPQTTGHRSAGLAEAVTRSPRPRPRESLRRAGRR